MAFFLKTLFRKSRLKKYSSRTPTGFMPLRSIRSALVILDGAEPDCLRNGDRIGKYLGSHGISVSLVFVDLRKIRKTDTVYVSGDNVISRRNVNWFGMPKIKSKGNLFLVTADLMINLRATDDFTGDFMSRAVAAGFKIGTLAYPGNPFDLTVTGKEPAPETVPDGTTPPETRGNTDEKIDAIYNFLKQIV